MGLRLNVEKGFKDVGEYFDPSDCLTNLGKFYIERDGQGHFALKRKAYYTFFEEGRYPFKVEHYIHQRSELEHSDLLIDNSEIPFPKEEIRPEIYVAEDLNKSESFYTYKEDSSLLHYHGMKLKDGKIERIVYRHTIGVRECPSRWANVFSLEVYIHYKLRDFLLSNLFLENAFLYDLQTVINGGSCVTRKRSWKLHSYINYPYRKLTRREIINCVDNNVRLAAVTDAMAYALKKKNKFYYE